ncbi:ABC transporter permease [Rhizobium sp. P38BS-XIX]|uniref:ABC transporter permease n=1 Tax=Rhizobium sp. P38BS-XIX TaxID=2726740 RepID=UPI0019809746|nr:ABC transporter permease [Rhizobium sp. P38BS-XIX]
MTRNQTMNGSSRILMLLGVLWIVVVVLFGILKPSMFSQSTITTILQFSTILALVALGQGLVVLAGGAGIDLSVGGTVSLSATLTMLAVKAGMPTLAIPVACILIGAALGALNGLLVTRLSILPLIATLGTLFIYSGLAVALTGGAAQSGVPAWLLSWGRGVFFGLPVPFTTVVLPAFLFGSVVLMRSAWGAWIFALGYNERSARLVGIPVDRVRLTIYALGGTLAGLAGLVSIAWLGSARPNIGQNLELESLTAVMLGGIAITGGIGGVIAAVVLLVTLKTGLLQLNVNTVWQVGLVGALLIAVLLIDRISKHWR